MQETLRQALAELAAASEREYLNDDADSEEAERYYADVDDSEPAMLVAALSRLLETSHKVRPTYRPAVELYPWVDLQPNGKIRSVYTQEEFDPRTLIEEAAEIEARRAAFRTARKAEGAAADASVEAEVERVEPYNCEHVVPQSWFAHDEPMRGDLHHLLTCESKCNGFRGNSPFADYPDQHEKVRERCGNSQPDGFEPWSGKGPVARATLYFLIRYPEALPESDAGRSVYSGERLMMLLEWHQAEPVSEYERHRNAAIFERQGNRNPVIDHPEWAPLMVHTA